mgnify:CR=1 FL=1
MLHHLVLFNLNEHSSEAHIDRIYEEVEALKAKNLGIISVDRGVKSADRRSAKYDYGYMITLTDKTARDRVLNSPEYRRIKTELLDVHTADLFNHGFSSE